MIDFGGIEFSRVFLAVLLNFVWQAALIAVIVFFAKSVVGARHVRIQYGMSVVGLFSLIAFPLASFCYFAIAFEQLPTFPQNVDRLLSVSVANVPASESRFAMLEILFLWFDAARNWWLGLWLAGAVVLMTRTGVGLITCFSIRKNTTALPENVQVVVRRVRDNLQLGAHVSVVASSKVAQAVATGIIKPMVLLPVAWVSEMPIAALEAVIAHELAHIKRLDLWVVTVQRCVETVFFFHPATWWISNSLTQEREACCDRLAVEATGNSLQYVETLAMIASARHLSQPSTTFCTAFTGGKKMKLLRRISLVLEPARSTRPAPMRPVALIACLSLLIAMGSYSYGLSASPISGSLGERQENEDEDENVKTITLVEKKQNSDDDIGGKVVYRWLASKDGNLHSEGVVDLALDWVGDDQDGNKAKHVRKTKKRKVINQHAQGTYRLKLVMDDDNQDGDQDKHAQKTKKKRVIKKRAQGIYRLKLDTDEIKQGKGGHDHQLVIDAIEGDDDEAKGILLHVDGDPVAIDLKGKLRVKRDSGIWIAGDVANSKTIDVWRRDGTGGRSHNAHRWHGKTSDEHAKAIEGLLKLRVKGMPKSKDENSWIELEAEPVLDTKHHKGSKHSKSQKSWIDLGIQTDAGSHKGAKYSKSGSHKMRWHVLGQEGQDVENPQLMKLIEKDKKAYLLKRVYLDDDRKTVRVELVAGDGKHHSGQATVRVRKSGLNQDQDERRYLLYGVETDGTESGRGKIKVQLKRKIEKTNSDAAPMTKRAWLQKRDGRSMVQGQKFYFNRGPQKDSNSKSKHGKLEAEHGRPMAANDARHKSIVPIERRLTKVRFEPGQKGVRQGKSTEKALSEILTELKKLRREVEELKGKRHSKPDR